MSSAVPAQSIQERKKKPLLQYALRAEWWVLEGHNCYQLSTSVSNNYL